MLWDLSLVTDIISQPVCCVVVVALGGATRFGYTHMRWRLPNPFLPRAQSPCVTGAFQGTCFPRVHRQPCLEHPKGPWSFWGG